MDEDDGMMLNIVSIEAPKKQKRSMGKIRTATPSFKQLRTGDFKGMAHLKHEAKVRLKEKYERKKAEAAEGKAESNPEANGSKSTKKAAEVKDVEMKENTEDVKPVKVAKKRTAEELTNGEQGSDQPPQKKRKTEEAKPEVTKEADKTEKITEEKPKPKADFTKRGSVPQHKSATVPNPANLEFAPKSLSRLKQMQQEGKSLNKKQLLERTKKVVSTETLFSEKTFADLNLDSRLVKNLEEYMTMPKPTLIQKAAVPAILSKHDALVQAETGSGKTLTYLLPIVQDLVSERLSRTAGTAAIIIAPTRELSLQIFEVLTKLLKPFHWIVPGILIGGEKRKSEKARIRKGLNVVVATPGRLLDHLKQTNCFNIAPLRWLILDEADRLLDLGFERDLTAVIQTLNSRSAKVPVAGKSENGDHKDEEEEIKPNEHKSRQTVLCSATLNKDVDRLAIMSLVDPLFISLDDLRKKQGENGSAAETADKNEADESGDENDEENDEKSLDEEFKSFSLPSGLQQHSITVHPKWRHVTLAAFIRQQAMDNPKVKIIVFMSTSDEVEFYFTLFGSIQIPKIPAYKVKSNRDLPMEELIPIPMFKLYGDLSQEVRRSTYLKFCEIPSGVLFCTDVAARGLDMPNISWIVQYDVPSDPKSYIHRIGRTARIGASGDALLFLLPSERPYVDILKTKLNMQFNDMSVDDIMAKLKVNLERNVNNDPLVEAASLQHLIESTVEESKEDDLKTMAAKAYQSFIRSYATHTKVTKEIFHVKNLHLGHVAKSFGLKDPPSVVGRAMSKQRKKIDGKKLVAKGVRKQKSQSIKKLNVLDEFAA